MLGRPHEWSVAVDKAVNETSEGKRRRWSSVGGTHVWQPFVVQQNFGFVSYVSGRAAALHFLSASDALFIGERLRMRVSVLVWGGALVLRLRAAAPALRRASRFGQTGTTPFVFR